MEDSIERKMMSHQQRKMLSRDRVIKRLCDESLNLRKRTNKTYLNDRELIKTFNEYGSYYNLPEDIKLQIDSLEYKNPDLYYYFFPMMKVLKNHHDSLEYVSSI